MSNLITTFVTLYPLKKKLVFWRSEVGTATAKQSQNWCGRRIRINKNYKNNSVVLLWGFIFCPRLPWSCLIPVHAYFYKSYTSFISQKIIYNITWPTPQELCWLPALDTELLQAMQQRQAVGFHGAGVASCKRPHLVRGCIHPCLQSLLGYFHLKQSEKKEFCFKIRCLRFEKKSSMTTHLCYDGSWERFSVFDLICELLQFVRSSIRLKHDKRPMINP